ncbi:L,D-transpeptidase [Vallitalea okinawensis]|uniref:L,D-transpeptidase n=1 Tax=Vallitalea okinawensis TaxID=2078660 RepID=UPI000CFBC5EC|nr:L,D-transpeptidase [Vallitalea okinawensis]
MYSIWLGMDVIKLIKDFKRYIVLIIVLIIIACFVIIIENMALTTVEIDDDQAILHINFLFPMEQLPIDDYIHIESEYNHCNYQYSYDWKDSNELVLVIKELDYPKGQRVDIEINDLPTKLLFDKRYEQMVQFECQPELIDIQPKEVIPTSGPINLVFNTLMDERSLVKNIEADFDYEIYPLKYYDKDGKVIDYSHWIMYPNEALNENSEYSFVLKNISSFSGDEMEEEVEVKFVTAKKPGILNVEIDEGFDTTSIYPKIVIQADTIIKKGRVRFQNMTGEVKIENDKMIFLPDGLLEENTDYKMSLQVMSIDGEWSEEQEYDFKTMSIKDDQLWVEVILGDQQEVIVKRGKEVIRKMPCSGGTEESPSVYGTYYLQDRGDKFFSPRFGQGAHYWVRITEQYLFHGVPFDEEGNMIQEELEKIGQPASHGCIRLLDEDAKWFYEHVPHNTMVLIRDK